MAKPNHAGKGPRGQQQYFEAVSRQPPSSTVDDESMLSTTDSDVSVKYGEEVQVSPSYRKKRKKSGLNQHFNKHLATYVVGIISICAMLYLALGLPMYGTIQKMSNQIEGQKELNNSLMKDFDELEDSIVLSNSEIKSKLHEIDLKLQEQAIKLESLDQLVKGLQR